MEHVVVRWEPERGGYWLDPRPYLELLPVVADALPTGARSYVLASGHYDFSSVRCVKDLWFVGLAFGGVSESLSVRFGPNTSKHSLGLAIDYQCVRSVSISSSGCADVGLLGSVLLDEVLASEGGLAHEIVLTGGVIRVTAADLEARWEDVAQ